MPSPRSIPTRRRLLEPEIPSYKIKTHPRKDSETFRVVGARRGLPAWKNLNTLSQSTTGICVDDQVVVYYLDEHEELQQANALVLEIRVLPPIRSRGGPNKDTIFLLVAWFYEGASSSSCTSDAANLVLSSHLDVVSIESVEAVVNVKERIPIHSVLIIHTMTRVNSSEVKWLPERVKDAGATELKDVVAEDAEPEHRGSGGEPVSCHPETDTVFITSTPVVAMPPNWMTRYEERQEQGLPTPSVSPGGS
ncbi:hypothetical protein Z517_09456 [Fonsecaea pedrosoi CBS 271.37]|uniref:Uncharacterized protein n=1 Tax=Fonsecaea pedrosoi CBS 271.37 TaxID=1442368 RepID=A0A0D2DH66_9EURO|nr:uncharacterized protein Z517_09456 [Fonsecaea pedrosoi CBS 271.37]KIW77011.1 hypothetical protein Z517_09456 [Fonsecaea pedrosoi CBS 271.37]